MRQRGYAVFFVLVLLAACAGGFFGGRFLIGRIQRDFGPQTTWVPSTTAGSSRDEQVTQLPAAPPPTTVVPALVTTAPPRIVMTVPAPAGVGTPTREPVVQEATPTETATASPSPSPAPVFPFVLARPVRNSSGDCPGNYILGLVTDRGGKPVPGVGLSLADEYGNQETTLTKAGADAGRYDFPLFGPPRRFYLTVVDASGRPISPKIEIPHGVGANAQATCHWVDWQRQ